MAKTRPDGWWYPWIFVVGMGIVIVVNVALVVFAISSFTGVSTKDHYRKGLAYDTAIEADRQQVERGWAMELAVETNGSDTADAGDGSGGQSTRLSIDFADKNGRPIEDLVVRAVLVRPTHDGFDQQTTFEHRGDGRYAAVVILPLAGQWEARIDARRGDERFRENRRIHLPQ